MGSDATGAPSDTAEDLKALENQIAAALRPATGNPLDPKRGKVVRFEIFMYAPRVGESIYIDNIRLSATKAAEPPAKVTFTVAGTDCWAE